MSLAALSGIPIVRGQIVVPFSGLWHADLVLAQATDVSGVQSLVFAGVTWTCAYLRAIDFSGDRGVRVVAGQGGWLTSIAAKQYGNGPIPTVTVLQDAAAACGEPSPVVDSSVAPTLGAAWVRPAGRASLTLQQVLGDAWWANTGGVVQSAPRSGTVTSAFQALRVDGAEGLYEIGTDAPNDWQPGVSFSGPTVSGTVSRVTHVIRPSTLRTEVLVP